MKRISPGAVVLARAVLTGDDEDVPASEDVPAEDQLGMAALITGLFILAVQRQFPQVPSRGEIIRFVAELRAALPSGTTVDARAAEGLITTVMDAKPREEIPQEVRAEVVLEVINYILDPAKIGTDELEAVLAKAVEFAEEHGLDAQLATERAHQSRS
ncbi:hypothetical protein [Micromonospora sp. NBC_01813]|uniref:hypothetical protein n=1 Tax=Micromonospora sp. NBC_01813 TaxID=2975988 RepID=UPI002DD8685A|nr:hypothetical protein [Micromonospora sp. NBC_01813]WSA08001.1 hypothetical protein OG958_27925 [Micromonospora sp. NBC_01813]